MHTYFAEKACFKFYKKNYGRRTNAPQFVEIFLFGIESARYTPTNRILLSAFTKQLARYILLSAESAEPVAVRFSLGYRISIPGGRHILYLSVAFHDNVIIWAE